MATNYSMGNPAVQQPSNFSELQKMGQARPPSPQYQPAQAAPPILKAAAGNTGAQQTGSPYQGKPVVENANQMQAPYQPYTGQRQVETAQQMGAQPQPGQNISQDLYNRMQNRPPAQTFNPGQNPWLDQTNNNLGQAINNAILNPSPYSSDAYRANFDYGMQQINQQGDYARRQLQEAMARRGMDLSTLTGQKYSDLGTEQARAITGMNANLLGQMAQNYGADRNAAFQAALGYGNQLYGQGLGTFQANQNAQGQWFDQGEQMFNDWNNYNQQQFNNQYATNQFNAQQQQYNDQMLLAMLGYTG